MLASLSGQSIGPYQVMERVGLGGMASIYKAYQTTMQRYVAIKVLPPQMAEDDPTFLGRFQQEARTIARLEHPNILPVYDYGEANGYTYLVMRYIEGGTVKDIIERDGPVAPTRAVRLVKQVADGLHYAHQNEVIHRDIKPSNVLVDDNDHAYLMDFGIAKLLSGTARFTGTDMLIGTPAYMSPEQAQGQSADARSDIYSLGVILYELVTGQAPYEAETPMAVLLQHIQAPLRAPRTIRHDLPEAVELIVLRAMAKDANARFQSAADMALELDAALVETQVSTRRHDRVNDQPTVTTPLPATEAVPLAAEDTLLVSPNDTATREAAPERTQAAPEQRAAPQPSITPPRRAIPVWALAGIGAVVVLAVLALAVLLGPGGDEGQPTGLTETGAALAVAANQTETAQTILATDQAAAQMATEVAAMPTEQPTDEPTDAPTPAPSEPPTDEPAPTAVAAAINVPAGEGTWRYIVSRTVITDLARVGDRFFASTPGGLLRWSLDPDVAPRLYTPADGLPFLNINTLAPAPDGSLWLGAPDIGVARVEFDANDAITSSEIFGYDEGLTSDQPVDIYVDAAGRVYVAQEHGAQLLDTFDGAGWNRNPPLDLTAPALRQIGALAWHIMPTSDGALWIGTDAGAARWDFATESWSTYFEGQPVFALYEDQDSNLLIANEEGVFFHPGLDVLGDPGGWDPVSEVQAVCAINGMLHASDGGYWFTCMDNGLVVRANPATGQTVVFGAQEQFDGYPTGALLEGEAGGIWVGTTAGLRIFNGRRWVALGDGPGAPPGAMDWLYEASDGALWMANHNWDGIAWRYDPAHNTWHEFPLSASGVNDFLVDESGDDPVLWAVASEGGLVQVRTADGRSRQYTAEDGYAPSVAPYALAQDGAGNIWIGDVGGLMLYDTETGTFTGYELASDGDPLDAITHLTIGPDGTLYAAHEAWNSYTLSQVSSRILGQQLDTVEQVLEIMAEDETAAALDLLPDLRRMLDSLDTIEDAIERVWGDDRAAREEASDELLSLVNNLILDSEALALAVDEAAPDSELAAGMADLRWLTSNLMPVTEEFIRERNMPWHVGATHIYVYAAEQDEFVRLDGPDSPARLSESDTLADLAVAPDGSLWVSLGYDALYRWDGENWERLATAGAPEGIQLGDIAFMPDGTPWVFSPENGFYTQDDFGWLLIPWQESAGTLHVNDLLVTADGSLWLSIDNGLVQRVEPTTE